MSNETSIDITPGTGLLKALRNQRLGWTNAIAELIDNSLDAGATRIEIELRARSLQIKDDGCGCDDIGKMLTLGFHHPHSTTRLGMYGVGLKDAALWFWGEIRIATNHVGTIRFVTVAWDKMKSWNLPGVVQTTATPTICEENNVEYKQGTTIVFRKIEQTVRGFDKVKEDVAYRFCPALIGGKQIVFVQAGKKEPLPVFEFPALDDVLDVKDAVDGKSFHLKAGIVREGEKNPRPGFTIAYKHRVITCTSEPCGNKQIRRFFAWVQLLGDWPLEKNKSGIRDAELLYERLAELCKPLLEKASELAQSLEISTLQGKIQAMLKGAQQILGKEKRRKKQEPSGPVEPVETIRKRVNVSQIQNGKRPLRKSGCREIVVEFDELDEDVVGEHEPYRVTLNKLHPAVKSLLDSGNWAALAMCAISLFSIDYTEGEERKARELPGMTPMSFEANFAKALMGYDWNGVSLADSA